MADFINPYERLAAYLDGDDIEAGRRAVDRALLDAQRARARASNIDRVILLVPGPLIACSAALWAYATFDVFNPIVEQFPILIVPRWVMVLLLGTGLALLWWGFRRLERVTPVPRPPQAIAEWLAGEGKTETFSYWAQCYWPLAKLYAYRRTWFGFTWWRRMPRLRVRDRWTVEQSRPPGCYFDE